MRNFNQHFLAKSIAGIALAFFVSSLSSIAAPQKDEEPPLIARKFQIGVARSNLGRVSEAKQTEILEGIKALGAGWVRDGYNQSAFEQAKKQHLKILDIIGVNRADFDESYSKNENAGDDFCKRCGWTGGSSKLSKVDLKKWQPASANNLMRLKVPMLKSMHLRSATNTTGFASMAMFQMVPFPPKKSLRMRYGLTHAC